ncbi:MAG TPA: hypothetical protein VGM80_15985 [Gaiellaceae bacterium]|jgi:hypothetical protein
MKQLLILIAGLIVIAAVVAVSGNASSRSTTTLDLTGKVTGFHTALDAKPAGPSAGDIGYTTGLILEHGKRVGRFQGVCTSLPHSSQQCSFTLGLPGGQIVVESGYGPSFNTGSVALEAVVGGTGTYAGARGQGRDREVTNTRLSFHLQLLQ